MAQYVDILRFMTGGCLILIIIKLARNKVPNHQKIPASLFSISVLGYLLVDWEPLHDYLVFYVFFLLAISLPYAFWLFSRSLFDDEFRLRPWTDLILMGFLLIQVFFYNISRQSLEDGMESIKQIISVSQYILPLLFVVLGIVSATRKRQDDLILARYQFRAYFILLTASLIVLTLLSEISFSGKDVPVFLDLLQKIFIAGLTFLFASQSLIFKPGFFLVLENLPKQESAKPEVDNVILERLSKLMDHQQFWCTEGLTIRQLAETLQVKEYKLRNTINQYLGFRNFNDFLHSYRIKEAGKLLADPEKKDFTILEIAYEVGYNSLAPFNKAFKQIKGMTPTDWRRSKMH